MASSSADTRSGRWAALSAQHQAESAKSSQSSGSTDSSQTSPSRPARPLMYQDGTFSVTGGANSSMSPQEVAAKQKLLTAAEVGMVNKRAQMEATLTGILSAGALGVASRKILRLSPNATAVVAIGGGCFVGFIESRTILSRGMTALMYAKGIHPQQQEPMSSEQHSSQVQNGSSEFLKE